MFLVYVLLFFVAPAVRAGPFYPYCVGVCGATCVAPSVASGPLAPGTWTACFQLCLIGCGASCVSPETSLSVLRDGVAIPTPVSEVIRGDRVLSDGHEMATVSRNVFTPGNFTFVELTTMPGGRVLTITPDHGVVLHRVHDGVLQSVVSIDAARNVVAGDTMLADDGSLVVITEVKKTVIRGKYTLETTSGTVVANGLLIGTMCGEEVANGEQLLHPKLVEWKARHQFLD